MLTTELVKPITTILISVLAAAITALLIDLIKNKKRKMVEQIIFYDDNIRIIISIFQNSIMSFILAYSLSFSNLGSIYKAPFIALIGIIIVLSTYGHLRFHKSYLIDTFQNKEIRIEFIMISIFIVIIWIITLIFIFSIEEFGDNSTHLAYTLILFFYSSLFIISQYFKWGNTRSYNKIVVSTIDDDRYETKELIHIEDYVVIYERKNDRRIVLPNHQIKKIAYEYEKTTLRDFIDKEH